MQTHFLDGRLLNKAVNVLLVGAGGTGSHVLRRLATLHTAWQALGHPYGLDVTVMDPDVVSATNVGRQLFYPSDIGQSKANLLVNRCNLMMGTQWNALQDRFTERATFNGLYNIDLVIGCVDNRKARSHIVKWFSGRSRPVYYLDVGNREHDGQAILGQIWPKDAKFGNTVRLPHAGDLYPELLDESLDAVDETPSCSLAEALEKQSLFVNDTMATVAVNMLWELFRYGQITHHGQFVNLKTGRVNPLPVDPEAWKRFGYGVKKKRQKQAA